MSDDGVLKRNSDPRVVESLYEQVADADKEAFSQLPTIDIELEQVEYL
jgi:hypothetical protein